MMSRIKNRLGKKQKAEELEGDATSDGSEEARPTSRSPLHSRNDREDLVESDAQGTD